MKQFTQKYCPPVWNAWIRMDGPQGTNKTRVQTSHDKNFEGNGTGWTTLMSVINLASVQNSFL